MTQKAKTLGSSVAILGVAGIIAKLIGMVFRIELGDLLQPRGYGIYMGVYPTYTMLLSISTAGIPVAISRLVSESMTLGRFRQARAILRASLALLTVIGAVLTVLLVLFAHPLAVRTGDAQTAVGFMCIAPSILLVSVMSALRGYMQGRNNMTPTAISQIIEQIAKVIIALPLAMYGMRERGVVFAASGALLGISFGEGCALLYMTINHLRHRRAFALEVAGDNEAPSPLRALAGQVLRIALPITLGSMVVPLASFIDSAMVRLRLQAGGIGYERAVELYGMLTGHSLSLVNVPTVFATAVCIGLIPVISAARVQRRMDDLRATSTLGMRLGSLIGMPCAVGMSLLSTQLIRLLYPTMNPVDMEVTGRILSLSALTIFFFTQVQATTGVLQGAGYHKIPVYSLVAGVLCKVILNYTLVAIPSVNVMGSPVASIVCYTVSMLINIVFIVRKLDMRFDWQNILLRPGIATAGMGAAVWLVNAALGTGSRLYALVSVAAGVLVYAVLVFLVGALRREDMGQMPGGRLLERLLLRLRIWH